MKLPEPYKSILQRIGTFGIWAYLALAAFGILSLVTLFDTFDGRAHYVAGIVLVCGLPILAGYGAERILKFNSRLDARYFRVELLGAVLLAMLVLICGLLATVWPPELISENTPVMLGFVTLFLGLFCAHMFFGALFAGGFKHLIWRPLDSFPTVKAGLILFFLALMAWGLYLAITEQ